MVFAFFSIYYLFKGRFPMKKKIGSAVLRIVILIAVLLLAFFGLRYYFSSREVGSYEAPLTPVRTVKAEKSDIEQSIRLYGHIESEQMVPIVPFVSGTILEYDIKEGDLVEKDQVVAKIDSEPYRLQALQADAQAKALESAYTRIKNLYDGNAVTRQEFESIEAQRDAALAQKELADLQLSYASVKAPISGTVIMSKGSVGSIATNTDYIAIVANMDELVVNLSVSAAYYDIINDNKDTLSITVADESRGLESDAEVVSISPMVDPLSRSFNLKLRITSPDDFTLGSSCVVTIVYESVEDIYTLPSSVLRLDDSLYYVENGTAHYMEYAPEYENDELISCPPDMTGYDFVIEGQNSLFDGQSVRILEASGEDI